MGRIRHPERLLGVDPRLTTLVDRWQEQCPFDVDITDGLRRDEARQASLYAQGRTAPGPNAGRPGHLKLGDTITNAKTLAETPHGRGGAIDAMPLVGGRIVWTRRESQWPISEARLEFMQDLARSLGIVCGADWPSKDLCHFQVRDWRTLPMPGETLKSV